MREKKSTPKLRRRFATVGLFVLAILVGVLLDRVFLAGLIPAALVPADAVGNFRLMAIAWNLIESRYVDPNAIKPDKMTYGAIGGMVDALGDTGHSSFLSPEMAALSQDLSTGNFAGIGAEIGVKNGQVVIVSPIDGTPASRAGLRPGDTILKVDGTAIGSLSLTDVVTRIRGPVGTPVVLQILSPKAEKPHEVRLVRAQIPIDSVHWQMIPGTKLADVRISTFSKGTAADLAEALNAAKRAGATGLVLDLRDDPGGLLEEAVGVASLFLADGPVLQERDRGGKTTPVPVEPGRQVWNRPVAVLINGGTASAAEIVAGALRDRLQAPLIGEKSFGTGTVLQEFDLPGGSSMLLAVGEWLTSAGESFWHKGLAPTTKVTLADGGVPLTPREMRNLEPEGLRKSDDTQLKAAINWLERKLDGTGVRSAASGGDQAISARDHRSFFTGTGPRGWGKDRHAEGSHPAQSR
jgi:carboxyl-terminal processing protease